MKTIALSLANAFGAQAKLLRHLDPATGLDNASKENLRDVLARIEECKGHLDVIAAQAERVLHGGRLQ